MIYFKYITCMYQTGKHTDNRLWLRLKNVISRSEECLLYTVYM